MIPDPGYIQTSKCSQMQFSDWRRRILERREMFKYLLDKFQRGRPGGQFVHMWTGAKNMLQYKDDKCEPLWAEYRETGTLEDAQAYEDALRDAEEFAMDYAKSVLLEVEFRKYKTSLRTSAPEEGESWSST